MDLLLLFKQYIQTENLFQSGDRLLLAVSGGVDSVVLAALCKMAGYDFAIAHCNFKLRGVESDRDEAFVIALAQQYSVEVFTTSFDTVGYAAEKKQSIETAARELRYSWFRELMAAPAAVPLQFILTAHHADDNMETVLMNFFRGTGIAGLRGILPRHEKIIRPLLFARRSELEAFVEANSLTFVTDHTNLESDYTRNYFRNNIIPLVSQRYPETAGNLLKNIQRFKDIEVLYHQSVHQHKKKLLEVKGNEVHIPVLKLLKAVPLSTIVYEIIKDYGFTAHQTDEGIALLKSPPGKYIQSGSYRLIRNRNWVILSPRLTTASDHILMEQSDDTINFAGGVIKLVQYTNKGSKISTDQHIALLNAGEIVYPLMLRKWKAGDYFYPLGMQKKKKLSRFFTDQKLSLTQKENAWVVEMDKKIIWITGMRIDNRFRITDNTQSILQLTYLPK